VYPRNSLHSIFAFLSVAQLWELFNYIGAFTARPIYFPKKRAISICAASGESEAWTKLRV
jgi:hypothetical protein